MKNQFQPSSMQPQGNNSIVYNRQVSQPHQPNHQQQQHPTMYNHQQQQPMGMYQNQMSNQNSTQQPKTEQIYAPVAHLQQKMIHQQQQNHLQQASASQVTKFMIIVFSNFLGFYSHILLSNSQIVNFLAFQQASFSPGSPESTEYGFGVQFQQHQSQFYQIQNHTSQQLNSHPFPGELQDGHIPSSSSTTSSPHHPNLYQQQYHPSLQQQQPNQQQQQLQPMYNINVLSDGQMPVSNSQQMIGNSKIV